MNQQVEQNNLKLILDLFLKREVLTRRDIVLMTNLTYPTVGKMIDKLLEKGLISYEGMTESTGGRRAQKYIINYERFFTIGVSLKYRHIRISLIYLNGKIFKTRKYKLTYDGDVEEKVKDILKMFLDDLNVPLANALGIGISFPGIVDTKQSIGLFSTILKIRNFRIKGVLEETFGLSVWLENDVNLMAMGENEFANITHRKGLLYIFWDIGIGSAIITESSVRREFAGQIGHVVVEPRGELCFCGKRGCLETVLSEASLINTVKLRLESNVRSSLHNYDHLNLINILREAKKGDRLGEFIMEKIEDSLGLALVNYIELFDPELLIFNGEIFNKVPFLVQRLKEYINSQIMFREWRELDIMLSELGNDAEFLGLLVLVKEHELEKRIDWLFEYRKIK
jgi:predicted NBD/HSP70 family sugar kinase